MARSKWKQMAEAEGMRLGAFFNRAMQDALTAGVRELVYKTNMDSGRAAYHWVVIPNRGSVSPGAWKQMTFNPAYGHGPVGHPGDRGKNRGRVVSAVEAREFNRAIRTTIKGRKPATRFVFKNSIPEFFDDKTGKEGSGSDYPRHAELKQAEESAKTVMKRKFIAEIERGNIRKRPLA